MRLVSQHIRRYWCRRYIPAWVLLITGVTYGGIHLGVATLPRWGAPVANSVGDRDVHVPERTVAPAYAQTTAAATAEGRIESPQDGQEVGERIEARGSVRQLPSNGHLWLAVKKGDLVWPKRPEVTVTGSSWSATVYEAGTPSGGRFNLVLYLVGAQGHQEVLEWLRAGEATGSFPGLRKISESTPLHTIQLRMR